MKLPDHFSVSQMKKYLACPLAYRLKYVDRLETHLRSAGLVFGKAFHVAAEQLHRNMMNGGARAPDTYHDALGDTLAAHFKDYEVPLKDGESRESLRVELMQLFDLYHRHRTSRSAALVSAERRIECGARNMRAIQPLSVLFVGYIDLVEEDEAGGSVVVDVKTASKSYNQAAVDGDLQLSAYAFLLWQETGQAPSRLRIDALVRNKTPKLQNIETTRTEDDLVRFWSLARAVWAAIQANHFYPNPSWLCSGCEFAGHCEEWGLHCGKEQ